jgi:multicomponent Na+:H+ antiporter subunit A
VLVTLAVFAVLSLVLPAASRALGTRVFYLAALVPAGAFVYAVVAGPGILAGAPLVERLPWIATLNVTISMRMDVLSWVLTLVVTGVGAIVLAYCAKYFAADDRSVGRFAAELLAFAGAMYGLVTADDVYLLFFFWEATSVLSYLLIGHYTDRRASRAAALQALIVTTAGGLAMLVGFVMLSVASGTSLLSEIIAHPPHGSLVTVAVILVLVGALSKSALVPFHFWLPAAMAAPTPVSAYLHAAAMVKAGIYLIARLAPAFALMPAWRPLLVGFGVATMLIGGWRAMRQHDLKLLLAYGTVSQLGFLTVVVGYGARNVAVAGLTLLLAHALFKSALFLVVGIIDRSTGTRDLRKLSGLASKAPLLVVIGALATASMAAIPPTLGFVAKEGVFTTLLEQSTSGSDGSAVAIVALIGVGIGSVLTVAYGARFLWGAFARKPSVADIQFEHQGTTMSVWPLILAGSGVVLGCIAPVVDGWLTGYANTVPAANASPAAGEHPYHLALWHGFEPALGISAITLAIGLVLFWQRAAVFRMQSRVPAPVDAGRTYWATMRGIDRIAARTTGASQRGSLPVYLTVILLVLVGGVGVSLAVNGSWPSGIRLWDQPAQVPVAIVMLICAYSATRATKRFTAIVLLGITGYGLSALFALQGAPDLALTQMLVETITLVAFVLVLRRLPADLGDRHGTTHRFWRAILAAAVGLIMALVALVALAARTAKPISEMFPEFALKDGHGLNIVNVTLVDIRGWDTMGEISVLVIAATGIASLIFIKRRTGSAPRLDEDGERRRLRERLTPLTQPTGDDDRSTADADGSSAAHGTRRTWLLAGWTLQPRNRSIVLEVVVRLLFHSVIVVSLYLLFAGHNLPGGGFAGGLLAGLALVARYLAGGRYELGAAIPLDAGKILGTGLVLAVGTATVPLLFGLAPLDSQWWEGNVPLLGHLELGTTTFFDIGVYLVVVGLVLDVLRSLGAEVDRHQEEELEEDASDELTAAERSTR